LVVVVLLLLLLLLLLPFGIVGVIVDVGVVLVLFRRI
jgi:hypothetical protein